MACAIEGVTVIARQFSDTGIPLNVDVSGILTGECNAGRVNIRLFDLAGNILNTATNVPLSPGPTSGTFTANIKATPECGAEIEVEVECVRECAWRGPVTVQCCQAVGVTYQLRIDTPDGRLDQTPQNILDIGYLEGCNVAGTYTLRLTPSGSDPAASIIWKETNLSTGAELVLAGSADALTYDYNFNPPDAESREIEAVITYPPTCGDASLSPGVTLRPCGDCASRGGTVDPATGQCVPVDRPTKEPPPRDPPRIPRDPPEGWEGGGCGGLRWLIIVAAILAVASVEIIICVPAAASVFTYAAWIFGAVAVLAGILYGILCKKPCKWGLLLAWQTSVGAGWVSMLFAGCCPALYAIGAGLIAAGLASMYLWQRTCKKSKCAVMKEYAPIIIGMVIPFISILVGFPAVSICMPFWVSIATGILEATLTAALAACIASEV